MNAMVQPPDYYTLMAMQTPTRRERHELNHRLELSRRTGGPSLRSRIRTMLLRTTLGPRTGDHVLGDGQWSPRAATR